MVSKTWNLFLINDRKIWMDIMRKTQPYFEFLSKQLLKDEDFTEDELDEIIAEIDTDKSDTIDFNEFVKIMT